MVQLALFSLLLAPHHATTDEFLGASGKEPVTVAGIQLGMSSGKVVNILGLPDKKTSQLALDGKGYWRKPIISIGFNRGNVNYIFLFDKTAKCNIPGAGAQKDTIIEAFGEALIDDTTKENTNSSLYFNYGVSYNLNDSDKTADFVVVSDINLKFVERELRARAQPDWKLELVESTGYTSFIKGKEKSPYSATIKGIIKNSRDQTVDILVRGIWRTKKTEWSWNGDKFLNASEITLKAVKPGESRIFEIKCDGFVAPENSTQEYSVELSVPKD